MDNRSWLPETGPGSALQVHPDANVFVDQAAASRLTLSDYYRHTYAHRPPWQRFEDRTD